MSADPRTIKAHAAFESGLELKPFEYVSRVLGDDDVEIAISHCGVCGSDLHTIKGEWGGADWPVVPGHEIVGSITAVGPSVKDLAIGDRVGVGALVLSCQDKASCKACESDNDPFCPKAVFTYNAKYADGAKSYGGYADYVRVSSKYAFKIPESIPSDVAAPLLCAGATVYTPLKQHVKPGMRFIKALDATPVAFSHSPHKEQEARDLGAEDFVVLSDPESTAKGAQSVDALLVTADAKNQPYDQYLTCIRGGGKLVMVGIRDDKIQVTPFMLIGTKVSILGSTIGGIKDMKEMLDLAAKRKVAAVVQKLPMSEVNKGIALVDQGKARFRVVLEN